MARSKPVELDFTKREWATGSDITKLGNDLNKFGSVLETQLQQIASELERVLTDAAGTAWERQTARRKSKKTANRLRRASEAGRILASEGRQLNRTFTAEFADLIAPKRNRRKAFDFKN